MTPSRLSVLGLTALGANDLGNCNEVHTEYDLLPNTQVQTYQRTNEA